MSSQVPTRILAGVTIPDTPLITASIAFARENLSMQAFNHIMRSFLFGFILAGKQPELANRDVEVHALSAILHDMGWSHDQTLRTPTHRFEVDSADAARTFIRTYAADPSAWDKHRVQLVWDAIALHTTHSISLFKEDEVAACTRGIAADFTGPEAGMSEAEYSAVVKEYPRDGFVDELVGILCGLCREKPETTRDNFVGQVGEEYLEGFEGGGKFFVDLLAKTRSLEE